MAKLFFSYSHVDEALRDRLEVHLSLMKNQGLIETWHDRGITAGSSLDAVIDENLEDSDVILLLVSADFIGSKYCYSVEMRKALERHAAGAARVIPVILEPCDWHSAPFGKLLAVPKDGKAVTTWPNQAEAWADVARQIRKAIEELHHIATKNLSKVNEDTQAGRGIEPPISILNSIPMLSQDSGMSAYERSRSSNLRLKKEFSDFDRDKFLHEAFDYMGKFFDESLIELSRRNSRIQVRYQPLGSQSFSAVIYKEGRSVSECSIRIGGLGGRTPGLAFSYSANAPSNSFNEMITIESDSQSMYFKPIGMQFNNGRQTSQLSEQGASEYFWALFIERLQR